MMASALVYRCAQSVVLFMIYPILRQVLSNPEDAINGRPRGVQELLLAVLSSGIRPGTHVVHDGWAATVALPWADLQMTNTVVNHRQGEVVVFDPHAPFPLELCTFTTNHVEAKWSALKRWMRKKAGGKMPRVDSWGLYIREFQWRTWFRGPTTPLMIDTARDHYQGAMDQQVVETQAEAREHMVIEPLPESEEELRGPRVLDLDTDSQASDALASDMEHEDPPPQPMGVGGGEGTESETSDSETAPGQAA